MVSGSVTSPEMVRFSLMLVCTPPLRPEWRAGQPEAEAHGWRIVEPSRKFGFSAWLCFRLQDMAVPSGFLHTNVGNAFTFMKCDISGKMQLMDHDLFPRVTSMALSSCLHTPFGICFHLQERSGKLKDGFPPGLGLEVSLGHLP